MHEANWVSRMERRAADQTVLFRQAEIRHIDNDGLERKW